MSIRAFALLALWTGAFYASSIVASPTTAVHGGEVLLSPVEADVVECIRPSAVDGEVGALVESYLWLQGRGIYHDGRFLPSEQFDAGKRASLTRSASQMVMASESTCAFRSIPQGPDEEMRYDMAAKRLLDAGLADEVIKGARRYFPEQFAAASSYGVVGKQGELVRAIGARFAWGGQPIEGIGNVRFAYYFCRMRFPADSCLTPQVKMVFAKYADQ